MTHFESWILRCHREAPNTCVVTSWRGATPETGSITVTGGRGFFMLGADFTWRMTDRLEESAMRGDLAGASNAWGRFLAVELA